MKTQELDGQIYLDPNLIPASPASKSDLTFDATESHPVEIINDKSALTDVYKRKLARWKDLTSAPKSRNKCVKMCTVMGAKFCCGWKVQLSWLYREAHLVVSTSQPADIAKSIEDCMKVAAIAAAIAAIISGGSAAAAIAEKLFYTCLKAKLGSKLVSVEIKLKSTRGPWT